LAAREGFEPDSDPKSNQQVTDSENNSAPGDPPQNPIAVTEPVTGNPSLWDRFRQPSVSAGL
jgi:hypothetical protein